MHVEGLDFETTMLISLEAVQELKKLLEEVPEDQRGDEKIVAAQNGLMRDQFDPDGRAITPERIMRDRRVRVVPYGITSGGQRVHSRLTQAGQRRSRSTMDPTRP